MANLASCRLPFRPASPSPSSRSGSCSPRASPCSSVSPSCASAATFGLSTAPNRAAFMRRRHRASAVSPSLARFSHRVAPASPRQRPRTHRLRRADCRRSADCRRHGGGRCDWVAAAAPSGHSNPRRADRHFPWRAGDADRGAAQSAARPRTRRRAAPASSPCRSPGSGSSA